MKVLTKLTINIDNNVCFSFCTLNVAKQKDRELASFKHTSLISQVSILNNFQEPIKSFYPFLLVVLFSNILRRRLG